MTSLRSHPAGVQVGERHLSLLLEYDGAAFHGWQRQPGGVSTVQGALESALSQLVDRPTQVRGSGRTDAGVHAQAQWVTSSVATRLDAPRLKRGLNALLPDAVRVWDLRESPRALDALRESVRKTYAYHVHLGESLPPLRRGRFARMNGPLDLDVMREAAAALEGTHDFTVFTTDAGKQPSCVRTLSRVRVSRVPRGVRLVFTAPGFLYNMVRAMATSLCDVGAGRVSVPDLRATVASGDRSRGPAPAPAHGLTLYRVDWSASVASALGVRRVPRGSPWANVEADERARNHRAGPSSATARERQTGLGRPGSGERSPS